MKPSLVVVFICLLAFSTTAQEQASKSATTKKTKADGKTIHVFVALCDNESQGIAPVPSLIGDGDDPRNNLYWGALLGLKTYFKKSADWELASTQKDLGPVILERLVFRHKSSGATLTADAYKGDRIKQAVIDFSVAASVASGEKADLVVYIGHNELMGRHIPEASPPKDKTKNGTDAMALCCRSKEYFLERLKRTRSRAVLLTTGLMAPEAYTLHDALDAWIADAPPETIREKAAQAYHKYQKCGIRGARGLFYSEAIRAHETQKGK